MTAIAEVASHIPDDAETVEALGRRIGISDVQVHLFTRFFGLREVRVAPDRGYADRLFDAASRLRGLRGNESKVKYVLAARTARDLTTTAEQPVDDVMRRLGLHDAIGFSVSEHACASSLYAIWMAGWLLRDEDPEAIALVLMGEVPEIEDFYLPGTSVMGDSTAACLVTADGERDRLRSFAYRMNPSFEHAMTIAVSRATTLEDVFQQHTEVTGEELGKTYIEEISAVLSDAVERAGLGFDDLALILPHNVNRISWLRVCRKIGQPIDKVLTDLIPITGHCYTADAFLNYAEATRLGRLEPGDHYMLVGVGTGGTFAAMVFER